MRFQFTVVTVAALGSVCFCGIPPFNDYLKYIVEDGPAVTEIVNGPFPVTKDSKLYPLLKDPRLISECDKNGDCTVRYNGKITDTETALVPFIIAQTDQQDQSKRLDEARNNAMQLLSHIVYELLTKDKDADSKAGPTETSPAKSPAKTTKSKKGQNGSEKGTKTSPNKPPEVSNKKRKQAEKGKNLETENDQMTSPAAPSGSSNIQVTCSSKSRNNRNTNLCNAAISYVQTAALASFFMKLSTPSNKHTCDVFFLVPYLAALRGETNVDPKDATDHALRHSYVLLHLVLPRIYDVSDIQRDALLQVLPDSDRKVILLAILLLDRFPFLARPFFYFWREFIATLQHFSAVTTPVLNVIPDAIIFFVGKVLEPLQKEKDPLLQMKESARIMRFYTFSKSPLPYYHEASVMKELGISDPKGKALISSIEALSAAMLHQRAFKKALALQKPAIGIDLVHHFQTRLTILDMPETLFTCDRVPATQSDPKRRITLCPLHALRLQLVQAFKAYLPVIRDAHLIFGGIEIIVHLNAHLLTDALWDMMDTKAMSQFLYIKASLERSVKGVPPTAPPLLDEDMPEVNSSKLVENGSKLTGTPEGPGGNCEQLGKDEEHLKESDLPHLFLTEILIVACQEAGPDGFDWEIIPASTAETIASESKFMVVRERLAKIEKAAINALEGKNDLKEDENQEIVEQGTKKEGEPDEAVEKDAQKDENEAQEQDAEVQGEIKSDHLDIENENENENSETREISDNANEKDNMEDHENESSDHLEDNVASAQVAETADDLAANEEDNGQYLGPDDYANYLNEEASQNDEYPEETYEVEESDNIDEDDGDAVHDEDEGVHEEEEGQADEDAGEVRPDNLESSTATTPIPSGHASEEGVDEEEVEEEADTP